MKRMFLEELVLKGGGKLDKEDIEAIMSEHGKSKTADGNTIATLTSERDGLKQQLADAEKEIKSYKDMDIEGIRAAAANWEQKYNEDTESLKKQLGDANYVFAVKEAAGGLKFSSESAKKAFVAELSAKKLPLQEGKLLGFADFVEAYSEGDPAAFVGAEEEQPVFVRGGSSGFIVVKN